MMHITYNSEVFCKEDALIKKKPIALAMSRMKRDISMVLQAGDEKGCGIELVSADCKEEEYLITADETNNCIQVAAGEELGFIYGLFYISEHILGIKPFWLFMDQRFSQRDSIEVVFPKAGVKSTPCIVKFRGWFINDEVLLSHWAIGGSYTKSWEMALETLLRCHGNMVIPGTDKNSRDNRQLAADMGLYITHHHAEPLGAEMFARAYPQLKASFAEYPDLYRKLWKDAVEEQKQYKMIWNLGFRGQGDCPFWVDDPEFDTDEKRGKLIADLILEQYHIVKAVNPNAYTCTNLYGEVMDLYSKGFLPLPDDIIKIWADNGFGAMVSRRQNNWNPRVYALPANEEQQKGEHGIYYHVSFYDLQAASHITMLPNGMDYVSEQLEEVLNKQVDDFWIINSSNIRPHAFELDAIRRIWEGDKEKNFSEKFAADYFHGSERIEKEVKKLYEKYPEYMVSYGENPDEHGGEQLYTYFSRCTADQWIKDNKKGSEAFAWLYSEESLSGQFAFVKKICLEKRDAIKKEIEQWDLFVDSFFASHNTVLEVDSLRRAEATVVLSYRLHYYGMCGVIYLAEAFEKFQEGDFLDSFYFVNLAADQFEAGNHAMRESEFGIWKGFYANDCLADYKFSAYILRRLGTVVRSYGDGPHYFHWQRQVMDSEEDRRITLITNTDNHMTDEELYANMKKQR